MNIQGKYAYPNISINPALVEKTPSVRLNPAVKDSFASSNLKVVSSPSVSLPIHGQYSPKQVLAAYTNKNYVNSLIASNPKLQAMIKENGIEGCVCPENVQNIVNSHLTTTNAIALQIANKMGLSQADKQLLEQACIFHDFGKILIPKEILNKPGFLNPEEKKIMDLHSELGYELLSKTGMNNRVLNSVKNHHMSVESNNDVLGQILSVADVYSALREQRSYKAPLSEKEAIQILDQKAQEGEVSTEVVNTLKSIVRIPAVA